MQVAIAIADQHVLAKAKHPDWQLCRDGCPGGESPTQISERADRVVQRVRMVGGDVLLFSSGHFIRVLAARWLAVAPGCLGELLARQLEEKRLTAAPRIGRYFSLNPSSLSALSYERLSIPACDPAME